MDTMDEAHRRDYRDKDEMWGLRKELEAFNEKPPSRCSPRTEDAIDKVIALLKADEARIVAVWD